LPPDPVSVVTLILAKTSAEEAFLKFKVGVSSTAIVMSPEDRVPELNAPVVVIVEAPLFIVPKPDVIDPEFNAPVSVIGTLPVTSQVPKEVRV
jgi:hypothetical protein